MKWETCTKVVVIISTVIAELTHNGLAARETSFLPLTSGLALVGTLLVARRFPHQVLCLVLVLLYIMPGLIFLPFHQFFHSIPSTACLLGVMLSALNLRAWYLPRQWKFPLVLWALIVALSWPIIFLRELDFAPTLTLGTPLFNNGAGVPTAVAAAWVPAVAVTQGVGFLWIDWLFGVFGTGQQASFERSVLIPLGIGFLLTSLIAFYQALGDIRFLNTPSWIDSGRAPGGMLDANPFGVLAACWGPTFLVLALASQRRDRYVMAILAMTVCWLSVLFSGSRSAFLVVVMASLYLLWCVRKLARDAQQRIWLRRGLVGIFLVIGLIGTLAPSSVLTPFRRFRSRFPSNPSQWTLKMVVEYQFIERFLFGRTAACMLKEVPLTGIGVGSFHTLLNDYARKYGIGRRLPFDNALNWYLHQFAELGLLGSVGWVTWIIVFIRTLLCSPAPAAVATPVGMLKCLLVAFGIASLLGVHAQNLEMLLTFWTYTFWLSTYIDQPSPIGIAEEPQQQPSSLGGNRHDTLSSRGSPLSWRLWATIIVIGWVYAVILGFESLEMLRVPYRAAAADWNYTYGFYDWEQAPKIGAFRWTQQKAVTVIPVHGPWLCSTLWVYHPDASTKPVHVQVWLDRQLATELWMRDSGPLRRCLPVPDDKPRIAITIQVNRTWRPLDYGRGDPRGLGVAITPWTFAQSPLEGKSTQ